MTPSRWRPTPSGGPRRRLSALLASAAVLATGLLSGCGGDDPADVCLAGKALASFDGSAAPVARVAQVNDTYLLLREAKAPKSIADDWARTTEVFKQANEQLEAVADPSDAAEFDPVWATVETEIESVRPQVDVIVEHTKGCAATEEPTE